MAELTEESIDLNTHFLNLAKADMLNTCRLNDAVKEKLTAALLLKCDQMSAEDLIRCIERLDNSKVILSYQSLTKVLAGG